MTYEVIRYLRESSETSDYLNTQAADLIELMQARIAKLEKDAARLDWLESSKDNHAFCHVGYNEYLYYAHQQEGCATVREVIDTAMKESK